MKNLEIVLLFFAFVVAAVVVVAAPDVAVVVVVHRFGVVRIDVVAAAAAVDAWGSAACAAWASCWIW